MSCLRSIFCRYVIISDFLPFYSLIARYVYIRYITTPDKFLVVVRWRTACYLSGYSRVAVASRSQIFDIHTYTLLEKGHMNLIARLFLVFFILLLAACGGGSGGGGETIDETSDDNVVDDPNTSTPPDIVDISNTLELRVFMDGFGKSRFYIQGDQVWWQHINGEAPGLSGTFVSSTFLDNVAWQPVWPDSGKNAFCACESERKELANHVFSEDIAIETTSTEEVRIVQQTLSSGTMTAIIEIENRSSASRWKSLTIKPLSAAEDGDIIDVTLVDDLLEPLVDEAARAEYESDVARRTNFDAILAENVALDIPADPNRSLSFNSVYRSEWMLFMSAELPPAVCRPTEIFVSCYEVTQSQCEIVLENETNRCLNEYSNSIPGILNQPNDGALWGGVIGGCAGDAYAVVLAEFSRPSCSF